MNILLSLAVNHPISTTAHCGGRPHGIKVALMKRRRITDMTSLRQNPRPHMAAAQ